MSNLLRSLLEASETWDEDQFPDGRFELTNLKADGADEDILKHLVDKYQLDLQFNGANMFNEVRKTTYLVVVGWLHAKCEDLDQKLMREKYGKKWHAEDTSLTKVLYDPKEKAVYIECRLTGHIRESDTEKHGVEATYYGKAVRGTSSWKGRKLRFKGQVSDKSFNPPADSMDLTGFMPK